MHLSILKLALWSIPSFFITLGLLFILIVVLFIIEEFVKGTRLGKKYLQFYIKFIQFIENSFPKSLLSVFLLIVTTLLIEFTVFKDEIYYYNNNIYAQKECVGLLKAFEQDGSILYCIPYDYYEFKNIGVDDLKSWIEKGKVYNVSKYYNQPAGIGYFKIKVKENSTQGIELKLASNKESITKYKEALNSWWIQDTNKIANSIKYSTTLIKIFLVIFTLVLIWAIFSKQNSALEIVGIIFVVAIILAISGVYRRSIRNFIELSIKHKKPDELLQEEECIPYWKYHYGTGSETEPSTKIVSLDCTIGDGSSNWYLIDSYNNLDSLLTALWPIVENHKVRIMENFGTIVNMRLADDIFVKDDD